MGNKPSPDQKIKSFEKGIITISLNKKFYEEQEEIQGIVNLTLFQDFNATQLQVQLKGIEKLSVIPKHKQEQLTKQEKSQFKQSNILINKELFFKSPNQDNFPKGNYQYPFFFQLSNNLLSTFKYWSVKAKNLLKAEVQYKILAGLIDYQDMLFIKTKEKFVYQSHDIDTSNPMTKMFDYDFCTQNSQNKDKKIKFELEIKNPILENQNNNELKISIDSSDCKISVHRLKLQLLQNIELIFKDQTFLIDNIIWRKLIINKIPKNSNFTGAKAILVNVQSSITKNLFETIQGKNIRNKYKFTVCFIKKGGIFQNDQFFSLQIDFGLKCPIPQQTINQTLILENGDQKENPVNFQNNNNQELDSQDLSKIKHILRPSLTKKNEQNSQLKTTISLSASKTRSLTTRPSFTRKSNYPQFNDQFIPFYQLKLTNNQNNEDSLEEQYQYPHMTLNTGLQRVSTNKDEKEREVKQSKAKSEQQNKQK